MFNRTLTLASALVILSGCNSAGPTTITGLNGGLSFTSTGTIAGNSFSASGTMPSTQAERQTSSWAAAQASAFGEFSIAGVSPRTTSTHDRAGLFVRRQTIGSETITSSCSFNCNGFSVRNTLSNGSTNLYFQICHLTSGTITITEVSDTRVKGTFSGTGQCTTDGASPNTTAPPQTVFTVTSGTFDVARVEVIPVA